MSEKRGYHHGDLRAALIQASFDLLAECGLQNFSVAAVARSLGVSSAAPYRHFPDRARLLSAVSAQAAHDLREELATAVDMAEGAGVYVRFVARTGAGFQVIFAGELYAVPDDARRVQTRALITRLFELAGGHSPEESLSLIDSTIALAHGYASLYAEGFFARKAHTVDDLAARAVQAARYLAAP
ncbi:TetR/AcrR family transcriptional regulator [Actinoplanes bogorensis]|uniref:TetR/AcrR family transcriptional regulator n=1 Tax=Paractinoplanes bogorensis TaxID=1610840 RepID=A0ABS5Z3M2_9ACTN|nr:helix-turn-helix domain-containing protein [Actinoplanes bogorensis]MBU2670286.1 TetR/AcrR family transcriptional regulator [Actinoplanes bogorensis]